MTTSQESDLKTVVEGIKKLDKEESLEVSLCLLNLLLPFMHNNPEGVEFLKVLRDKLFENG